MTEAVTNPERWAAWRAQVEAWEAENPTLAADWNAAWAESEARAAALDAKAAARAHLKAAGVPERCVLTIDTGARKTEAVEAVRLFLASKATFLLLSGRPGCGKSTAAALALMGGGGVFVRATEASRLSLFDALDRDRSREMAQARMLVLDDMGTEILHDGWRSLLDDLLDRRYGAMRRTVITTNLLPASDDEVKNPSFRARYGARVADRIRHDGHVVTCSDSSMRVRA
ncbi:MAG: ATP-binding protein [Candidatus Thermoplasmatota archaeon]|jgi:DNA replication protein DnaC